MAPISFGYHKNFGISKCWDWQRDAIMEGSQRGVYMPATFILGMQSGGEYVTKESSILAARAKKNQAM
jgi:hypothetical protein